MKTLARILTSLVAVSAAALELRADDEPAGAEQRAREFIGRYHDAFIRPDPEALRELLAEDALIFGGQGEANTRDRLVEQVRSGAFKISKLDVSELKALQLGDVIVANYRVELAGEAQGQEFAAPFRYTTVFAKRDGKLRVVTSQMTAIAGSPGASDAPAPPVDGRFTDETYGFSLQVPGPWKGAPARGYTAPGLIRAAWAGERGASIVAFVQVPGQAFSPRFLVDLSAESQEQKLGAKVLAHEVRTVAGMKAMWMVVAGQGNGGAITGRGDVETTQHWVAIPREKDIVVLLLTSPSADYDRHRESFERSLGTLTLEGRQTEEQAQSK